MQAAISHVQKGDAAEEVAMEDPEAKIKNPDKEAAKKPTFDANLWPDEKEDEFQGVREQMRYTYASETDGRRRSAEVTVMMEIEKAQKWNRRPHLISFLYTRAFQDAGFTQSE
ncbi:hypothetical protein L6164_013844 [Bauhinia variegata]|uniref:Uncharacterized protein n=1 Tax=Bauhinia variegata TaxID=167791 RepID=A0ACB9NFR2_BAUVA|nr:hypothetical protein L6164_013844 [Bauhinia variegata]